MSTETVRLKDGEKGGGGGGGYGGEGREILLYLSLHCHHQNDSCIKTGSDERCMGGWLGGGGGKRLYTYRYTVTTRMTSA